MKYNIRMMSVSVIFSLIFNMCAVSLCAYAEDITAPDEKIIFTEVFPGDENNDFMLNESNTRENEWFEDGFIIESSTTPWRNDRFIIVTREINGVKRNMLKKTYKTATQQRPTRTLRQTAQIDLTKDCEYYVTYNFELGNNDEFIPMTDNQIVNFDALMLDFGSRTGCGIAKNSQGKTVPFVSFDKTPENIAYGDREIEKGILYNAVFKIETYSDNSKEDAMYMAVYPEGEEFSGEYDISVRLASNSVFKKISYHFRASQALNNQSDMLLGNVNAWKVITNEATDPEPGNLPEPIDNSEEMTVGESTFAYEGFNYPQGTKFDEAEEFLYADSKKGFSTGWLASKQSDITAGEIIEGAVFDGRGNVIFPTENTVANMRRLSEKLTFNGNETYYITWTQKGKPPLLLGAQSQKLEIGSSDGEQKALMIGLLKPSGQDTANIIVRTNGKTTKYGNKTLDLNKEYTMVARIDTDEEKNTISVSAYERGTCPTMKWDAVIEDVLPETADLLSFQASFKAEKYFGNLIIDKYDSEQTEKGEMALREIEKAKLSYSSEDFKCAGELVNELNEGVIKRELKKYYDFFAVEFEKDQENVDKAKEVALQIERMEFTAENSTEIRIKANELTEYIRTIKNPKEKALLEQTSNSILDKLEDLEVVANSFVDEFDQTNGTPVSENGWKADVQLQSPAAVESKVNNSLYKISGNIYHDISKSINDRLYIGINICENNSIGFVGLEIGDYQLGAASGKLQIRKNNEVIKETAIIADNGTLMAECFNKELTLYWITETNYTCISAPINAMSSVVGIVGADNASAYAERLWVEGISERNIEKVSLCAKSIDDKNLYPEILKLKEQIKEIPDCNIKNEYSGLSDIFLNLNRSILPVVQSVSVKGSAECGNSIEAVYILDDKGENQGETIIKWNGTEGGKNFRIPSNYSDGKITLDVTPVNVFGEKGEEKSVEISVTKYTSGSGKGASGSGKGFAGVASTILNDAPSYEIPQPEFRKYAFLDIENHWAKEEIDYLAEHGLVDGIGNELFGPDQTVTRAQFAKMISKMLGDVDYTTVFEDVKTSDWYYESVSKVSAAGIMKGDGEKFFPEQNITREEIAATSYRLFKYLGCRSEEKTTFEFLDYEEMSNWAQEDISACAAIKLMNGMEDGRFYPKANATRAESSVIIWRIIKSL